MPSSTVASLRVLPSLCAFLAHLATSAKTKSVVSPLTLFFREHDKTIRTIVAKTLVQDGGKHEGLVEKLADARLVGLNADDAMLGERSCAISEQADRAEQVGDHDGLEHVKLGSFQSSTSVSHFQRMHGLIEFTSN